MPMPTSSSPEGATRSAAESGATRVRLESWKEISAFMGRRVRTLQRWEAEEGLPVHRHRHRTGATVYAFGDELEAWRDARSTAPGFDEVDEAPPEVAAPAAAAAPPAGSEVAVETAREATASSGRSTEPAADSAAAIAPALEIVAVAPTTAAPAPARRRLVTPLRLAAAVVPLLVGAGVAARWSAAPPAAVPPLRVAVAPFQSLGPEPEPPSFAAGLTEETRARLAFVRPERVAVLAHPAEPRPAPASREAEDAPRLPPPVDYLVEGAVRSEYGRLRITAKLIDGRDYTQRWTAAYEGPPADLIAMQAAVADRIAHALEHELGGDSHTENTPAPPAAKVAAQRPHRVEEIDPAPPRAGGEPLRSREVFASP